MSRSYGSKKNLLKHFPPTTIFYEQWCPVAENMAAPLPPTFVDLATAFSRPDVNVNLMGVVVDHLAATQSRGLDFVNTFTLRDPYWSNGLGLKCRCFNKKIDNLPAVGANGDVVLLRNVKVKDGKGQMMALSNPATSWIVFPQDSIPPDVETLGSGSVSVRAVAPSTTPSRPEAEYAIYLASTKDISNVMRPASATSLEISNIMKAAGGQPVASYDRFSLVKNLRLSERNYLFADLLAEIRRFYVTDNRVELSVTDYSGHPNLFNYVFGCDEDGVEGDRFSYMKEKYETWPGPWGQMTILVTLWDVHATYARENLKNGNFVFLRNVQISMGRDGNKMEGNVRGDRQYPDRVNVVKKLPRDAAADVDDPEKIVDASKVRMRSLLKRKRDYEKKAEEENKRFIKDASELKRKAEVDVADKSSNQNTKKKSKRQRGKAGKHANESKAATTLDVQKPEANAHVRCEKFEVPLKTVEEILDRDTLSRTSPKRNDFHLPFQNCCYHSKIRVVDFFPDNIADFAVPHRPSDYEGLSDYEDNEASDFDMTEATDVQWEWRFCLLVEDARTMVVKGKPRAQMQLLVAEGDGDYLLDMDASDLRQDCAKLQRVQEKLFVLWGDLQEQKEAAAKSENPVDTNPSSKPFECLIKEYGISVRDKRHDKSERAVDFERMFRVWGTCVK